MYKSYAYLHKRYVVDGKSISEIAKECNVSTGTIQNWLVKFELIRKGRSWKKTK